MGTSFFNLLSHTYNISLEKFYSKKKNLYKLLVLKATKAHISLPPIFEKTKKGRKTKVHDCDAQHNSSRAGMPGSPSHALSPSSHRWARIILRMGSLGPQHLVLRLKGVEEG